MPWASRILEFFGSESLIPPSQTGKDLSNYFPGQKKDALCNMIFKYLKDATFYNSKIL